MILILAQLDIAYLSHLNEAEQGSARRLLQNSFNLQLWKLFTNEKQPLEEA